MGNTEQPEAIPEDAAPEGIESWLTAPEAYTQYGTTAQQLTRAAQEGSVRRMRVKRAGELRGNYVYEPSSLEEARANGQLGTPLNTASEGMLMGGATMLGKVTEMSLAMGSKLIQAIDSVTRAMKEQSDANARQLEHLASYSTSMSDAFLHQFERLDQRNAANEKVILDYIQMRQELSGMQAETELEHEKVIASNAMKAAGLQALIDHAGPLVELAAMLMKAKNEHSEETKTESPAATPYVEPPESDVIDVPGSIVEA